METTDILEEIREMDLGELGEVARVRYRLFITD